MKISFNTARRCGVWAMLSLALAARGGTFSFPGTVPLGVTQWYLSDNTYAINAAPGVNDPGGFGFTGADYMNASMGVNAFDGAFLMRINGTQFASPGGAATLNGTSLLSGTANYSGLNTQVEFDFLQYNNRPIVRAIYSFQNVTAATINNSTFSWEINLGSDNTTVVAGTSGDSPDTRFNRWLVNSDSRGINPVVTLVRWGPTNSFNPSIRQPLPPANVPNYPGNTSGRPDLLADQYTVNGIQPQQTVRLLMFAELSAATSGDPTTAIDNAALYNSYADLGAAHLFDNLPGSFDQILNWAIPEPSATALLGVGLGMVWLRRYHRRRG